MSHWLTLHIYENVAGEWILRTRNGIPLSQNADMLRRTQVPMDLNLMLAVSKAFQKDLNFQDWAYIGTWKSNGLYCVVIEDP